MAKPSALSDEVLIRRAPHGGRNLTALAILATIPAAILVIAQFVAADQVGFGLPACCVAVAAGYWMLAVAARRGERRALTAFLVVASLLLAASVALHILTYYRTEREDAHRLLWLIIPALIIWVVARNRAELVELHRRRLEYDAFPTAETTSSPLWFPGGALILLGAVGAVLLLLLPAVTAAKEAKAARDFKEMINNEEHAVVAYLPTFTANPDQQAFDKMQELLAALNSRASELVDDAPSDRLKAVFKKYCDAASKWKSGYKTLSLKGPNDQETISMLLRADDLRLEAVKEFNALMAPQP